MRSNGARWSTGLGSRPVAAAALVAGLAVAASMIRLACAIRARVEREALREAELDDWASALPR